MTEYERIDRANRARQALDEFLEPALDALLVEYTRKLVEVSTDEPWESGKISKLAQAMKVTDRVKQHIRALVTDGDAATASLKHAQDIAKLPVERRKWLATA